MLLLVCKNIKSCWSLKKTKSKTKEKAKKALMVASVIRVLVF